MKAFITSALALALVCSMAACTSRGNKNSSSAGASVPPLASSNPGIVSDIESGANGAVSGIESGLDEMGSAAESIVTPTMGTDFNKIGALPADQVKWGPGVHTDTNTNRTIASEEYQKQYGELGAYFIAPEGVNKLYLTFDEGYENGYTPMILDTLKEKNVSAVFFITMPFAKSEPELVQRMIDEGHVIGNHTKNHYNPTNVGIEEAYNDIKELHDYIKKEFDYEMYLYRPPEGAFSEKTLAMVQQTGYTTVLWSFAYADWDPNNQIGNQAALERTTKYIHDGGIYLLHAVSKDNAEILGQLIDEIQSVGLEVAKWDLPYNGETVGQNPA